MQKILGHKNLYIMQTHSKIFLPDGVAVGEEYKLELINKEVDSGWIDESAKVDVTVSVLLLGNTTNLTLHKSP